MSQLPNHPSRSRSGNRKKIQRRVSLLLSRSRRLLERQNEKIPAKHPAEHGKSEHAVSERETKEIARLHRASLQLAEALRDGDRERCQYLAMALHDLKSPLMVAGSAARQLRAHEWSKQEREEWVDTIVRNVTSVEMVVHNLLDEARADIGVSQKVRQHAPVDVVALARDVVRDYGSVVNSHALKFTGDDAHDCTVQGDAEDLRRLLHNLISNAVKYSSRGREICVSVWRHEGYVSLLVEDEGCGIRASRTERLFQPFVRLEETKNVAKGDGLGLASVKRIADAHGAEIAVEGTLGQGATFEIKFAAK